ncbi:putative SNAP25 homologous protein SNAP30 [Juglans microcarpa x Juglans regia]|uniref:putative SNAP25 homologous protein SNAP30 n=1 Tax=Juglans microcarpa x Juglans regia TaxID=2249226 RepID=UPI001B7F1FED|nr:putative SNAP25 homologous protein SNAP30 [Juglans microcarpa x Juglans regia]XP_041013349.1 putative SNAP25 homologous protein SNAP30 [Juglans microcarpa x Juglans regia]XP_041013350.1 putative SNAP25 homologous protein SNAP30 [Juglans microcarpa x Juglans regia]XP_041013351.1 putative SNAP25 homologous protein SNAP30 [Juglans microcarpa x Juglans regia]
MFGYFKSPVNKLSKQKTVDPGFPSSNPFDSDTESEAKQTFKPARRTASEPMLITPNSNNPFDNDDDERIGASSSSSSHSSSAVARDRYRNNFHDSGGLQNQSVQELENYAVYKAEETTNTVNNCLKLAEDMREDATRTLDMLHYQGEQITRTHMMAADTEKDLTRGEKLLNNLGGMFSKTWKPKKTREIAGPIITADNSSKRTENHLDQREKLGLAPAHKGRSASRTPPPEPTNALQKVEVENAKQDDALSDLSNILGDLKNMAVDMGGELNRQNKALDHLGDDVDELNSRVKGANQRARRLLGK